MENEPPTKGRITLKMDKEALDALSELAAYHHRGEFVSALILEAHQAAALAPYIASELRAIVAHLEKKL